jgi:hypothetical protein
MSKGYSHCDGHTDIGVHCHHEQHHVKFQEILNQIAKSRPQPCLTFIFYLLSDDWSIGSCQETRQKGQPNSDPEHRPVSGTPSTIVMSLLDKDEVAIRSPRQHHIFSVVHVKTSYA